MKKIYILLITLLCSCGHYINTPGTYTVVSLKGDTAKLTKTSWWYRDYTPVKGRYLIPIGLKIGDTLNIYLTFDTSKTNIVLIR